MLREKECLACGRKIAYEPTRGKDRKYCTDPECVAKRIKDATAARVSKRGECITDGCHNLISRVSYELCEACYGRLRRRGTIEYKSIPYRTLNSAGYVRVREPKHCLSDSTGSVYEHRFVYYKHHGDGPFACNWCGKKVTWFDMHIDHLDNNITNNDISNLVASCPICNQQRGNSKRRQTMISKRGVLIEYNGEKKTAGEWAETIGITRASLLFRLKSGWTIEKALTTPRGVTGPKRQESQFKNQ